MTMIFEQVSPFRLPLEMHADPSSIEVDTIKMNAEAGSVCKLN